MERTSTQRHYNSADVLDGPKTLPRSKNISAPRSVSLAFFAETCDQRSLAHRTQCCLAARCGRKVEITQFTSNAVVWSFSKTDCKRFPVASRRQIRPEARRPSGHQYVNYSFFTSSGDCRQYTTDTTDTADTTTETGSSSGSSTS